MGSGSGPSLYARAVADTYRIGQAAEILGITVETLRRWERDGKLRVDRTQGGQRLVPAPEVARLLAEQHGDRPIAAGSARNRFPGVITEVKRDGVAATVEVQAGPHRVLALITKRQPTRWPSSPGCRSSRR